MVKCSKCGITIVGKAFNSMDDKEIVCCACAVENSLDLIGVNDQSDRQNIKEMAMREQYGIDQEVFSK